MRKSLLLSVLFGLIVFASCKKDVTVDSKDGLAIIPASTGMLVAFDLPGLMEKADFEYVKTLDFYTDMLEEATGENEKLATILEDPSKSGIDINQNMYMAVSFDPEGSEEVFTGFVLSLADPATFQSMLSEADNDLQIESGDGFQYASGDSRSIVAWNDHYVVLGGSNTYMDLPAEVLTFFNTTSETSVAQNKDLQKALGDEHDISMWLTSNPFADNPNAQFALGMAEIDPESLKDNFIHGHLDFKNGEIVGTNDLYLQKGLTKDLGKFFDDKVDTDYSAYVPKDNLLFAFTTALDIAGIDEVLSARPQSKGFLEYSLKQYDLTFNDIASTFGGDILITGVSPEGAGKPAGLFAMDIKDDTKLMDFINLGIENNILVADGNNIYKLNEEMSPSGMNRQMDLDVTFPDGSPRLILADDKVFITGSTDILAIIQNGGYARADRAEKPVTSLIGDHVFGGYFALKAIQQYDDSMSEIFFDQMEIKVDREHSEMRLDLEDKSTNALRQLFEMANESYLNENREAFSEPEAL